MYNPKPLRETARDIIKLDDKQVSKGLAEKMINPYNFTDRALQIGSIILLHSHRINYAYPNLNINPSFIEIGIETRYVKKTLKENNESI